MAETIMRGFAFPFAQMGAGLRWLSLSGSAGNIAAWVLYIGVCILPLVWVLCAVRRRAPSVFRAEDLLGAVLCVLLFAVMFFMVNPGEMPGYMRLFPQELSQVILGVAVWSVVLAWVVIACARRVYTAGEDALMTYLLVAACVLLTMFSIAVGERLWGLPAGLREASDFTARFFVLARAAADALPHVMNLLVASAGIDLLAAMRQGGSDTSPTVFSQETTRKAGALSRMCVAALAVTVLTGAGINVVQIALAGRLTDIHINIDLPLVPVFFALGALMFARWCAAAQALRDENESFV